MKTSEEVQKTILNTAKRLFYEQGYNTTGINQIIEESAVAKASLYHHYKSKAELLYAYLEFMHQNWFEQLHEIIDPISNPTEKILAYIDFRIGRQAVNNYGGCLFIKSSAEVANDDLKAFAIIDKNKMKVKSLLLKIIEPISLSKNQFSKAEIADMIYMLVEGATVTTHFQKNSVMLQNARAIVEKLLQ